jgi:glycosyltransferase involved in cell wall biosynthesis/Tfp pilus assembly protein PilF
MTGTEKTTTGDFARENALRVAPTSVRVGLLSPWNQMCGLATYAKFLVPHLSGHIVAVFAEAGCQTNGQDESFVHRCWQRLGSGPNAKEYSKLEAAIESARIDVLHLNCQGRFFAQPAFSEMLKRCQARGVKVVAHLHQLFTLAPENTSLVMLVDRVIVHSEETRMEAIANGARPEHVVVVPHGVDIRHDLENQSKSSLRARLGLPQSGPLVTSFGFIQPHKGMEAVIEAISHLRVRGIKAHGLIIGETRSDSPFSAAYLQNLQDLARNHKLEECVTFLSSYIPDSKVGEYLAASDLVVMNYQSDYFEASGACSLAVGVGAVVMASLAPGMMAFKDAVWHITGGYPPGLSAELLLSNPVLFETVRANAKSFAKIHAWPIIGKSVSMFYESLFEAGAARPSQRVSEPAVVEPKVTVERKQLKVLIQNRPGTFTHRGGDTVQVERLSQGLKDRGCDVTVDVSGSADPKGFDLVHLYNFATAEFTECLAKRAKAVGVPYVVTTLYEEVPEFHNQSHLVALHVMDYVRRGQDKMWWNSSILDLSKAPRAERFKADWIVSNAAALFPNGAGETAAIKRDFPDATNLVEIPLGHEVGAMVGPELFEREYGVKDFVFCVGRFETRKNQLMLLKALEDSDLTVVLASGGFSYQPEYDAAVRAFKRKGRTIIIERVSPEMLSSAYAACRVHALPSWYELPGHVSLEAAAHGKNIVVTRTGTQPDYYGTKAYYCQPWDSESINAAVMAAFYAPIKEGLVEMAKSYSWENTVDKTLAAYEGVVKPQTVAQSESTVATPVGGVYDMSVDTKDYDSLIEQGEMAARKGDYTHAEDLLRQASVGLPSSTRLLKAQGAVCLATGRTEEAKAFFERALNIAPSDPNLLTAYGMCMVVVNKPAEAMPLFERVLAQHPDHILALHQLLECSYNLNAFSKAESAVRRYLSVKPEDTSIRFCLAGVLYKQGLWAAASAELSRVVSECPEHQSARELQELITKQIAEQNPQAAATSGTSHAVMASMQEASEGSTADGTGAAADYFRTRDEENAQAMSYLDSKMDEVEDLKRDGKYDEAKEILEKVRRSPGLTQVQRERFMCIEAEFLVMDNELEQADCAYDSILKTDPNSARAMCGKGALAAERQEWTVAQGWFEKALAVNPKHDVGLAGLGLCAMVSNKEERAFELFTAAVAANPENRRALLGVLQLGYPLKKYTEIEKAINAYLELHPANVEMLYSFAGVLFAQGKVEQAKVEVEKILIFEPKHERALELRDLMRGEKPGPSVVM